VPCGAMLWTKIFLQDVRKQIPEFVYEGVDVVKKVVDANQRHFTEDPKTTIRHGDFVNEPVPKGFDLIFSRDALQHLTYAQVIKALQNFAESDARFVVVGTYPKGKNINLPQAGTNCFEINLQAHPFNLEPDQVLPESERWHIRYGGHKHLAVFSSGKLAQVDWKRLEADAGLNSAQAPSKMSSGEREI